MNLSLFNPTHCELVEIAAKWLAKKCSVVITEMTHFYPESPDAIGWWSNRSILIECKISRADFRADNKKSFRAAPTQGVGNYRYYLAPSGMIREDELPIGWGLLEWDGKRIKTKVEAKHRRHSEVNKVAEVSLLISSLRRLDVPKAKGISVKVYTLQSMCRASLGVAVISDGKEGA